MKTKQEWLDQIQQCENENKILKRKSFQYSVVRLLTIVFLVLGIVMSGYYKNQNGNVYATIALLAFSILVVQHNKIKVKIEHHDDIIDVLNRYLARSSDEWQNFPDDGSEFSKGADPTFLDLDLLGHASLYQLLNVAKTAIGKIKFYQSFTTEWTQSEIMSRQAAIEELYQNQTFSIAFQTSTNRKKAQPITAFTQLEKIIQLFDEVKKIKGLDVLCLVPLFTITLGILAYFKILPPIYFVSGLLLQFLFSAFISLKYDSQLAKYTSVKELVSTYIKEVKLMENEAFHSELLNQLRQKLLNKGKASHALKQLDIYLSMVTLRNNAILYLVFNGLFMYDLQCIRILEGWKKTYGQLIPSWIETIGDMEALISCSLVPIARIQTCLPKIIESQVPKIQATMCAHPLINQEKVVANSFNLGSSNIITGSNMSGKSTFMRSIGVNMYLALAGCRVCSEDFTCSKMKIISSMRLHDELSSGISTFYAEVLRVKQIMDESRKGESLLVLIDEIFKGTNSADRIVGSKEAIKKLHQPWILCMITTHDFELCTALDQLVNYHFSEHYIDNKIYFDYHLQKGQCKTTNAQHLMRMAGIID